MAGVVLIHGAWHGAWCWDGVVKALADQGVPVNALELPLTGFDDDVTLARRAIEEAGEGAVVCAHSYGGAVMTQAAGGLTNVGRLVYLTAVMLDTGEDLNEVMMSTPSELLGAIVVTEGGTIVDPAKLASVFYGDSSPETVARITPLLRPMPIGGTIPVLSGAPAWAQTASTYVVCTNDNAIAPSLQRTLAARAAETIEWPCDHSPFLSRPDQVATLLASYV